MPPSKTPATRTTDGATDAVFAWLGQHPELTAAVRSDTPAGVRTAVTSYLYPYDRFPETLDALIRAALDRVDWDAVAHHVGGKP